MAYIFDIDGEIIPYNYWEHQGYVNHYDVEKHLALANGDNIDVLINSPGGDVDEGFMIYTLLRKYAEDNKAIVTTKAKGRCDSSATIIYLAGDKRVANRFIDPFVHNAWCYSMEGESKDFYRLAVDLDKVCDKIAIHYADHTDLTFEEAKALMEQGSYISPEEAVRIRFSTEIDNIVRPAALNRILKKNNSNNNSNQKAMSKQNSLLSELKKIFALHSAKNAVFFTEANEELDFPDLEDGEEPKVGDKATFDGKPAEGQHKMTDGKTFVFAAGELMEIIDETEEDPDLATELEELRTENKNLQEQLAAQNSTMSKILKEQKAQAEKWKALNSVVSKHVVDDDSNSGKSPVEQGDKKGLSGAIQARKEKTTKK